MNAFFVVACAMFAGVAAWKRDPVGVIIAAFGFFMNLAVMIVEAIKSK